MVAVFTLSLAACLSTALLDGSGWGGYGVRCGRGGDRVGLHFDRIRSTGMTRLTAAWCSMLGAPAATRPQCNRNRTQNVTCKINGIEMSECLNDRWNAISFIQCECVVFLQFFVCDDCRCCYCNFCWLIAEKWVKLHEYKCIKYKSAYALIYMCMRSHTHTTICFAVCVCYVRTKIVRWVE